MHLSNAIEEDIAFPIYGNKFPSGEVGLKFLIGMFFYLEFAKYGLHKCIPCLSCFLLSLLFMICHCKTSATSNKK